MSAFALLEKLILMGACNIEGCDRPAKARGLCHKHYQQWWREAHPEKVRAYSRKYYEAHREQCKARSRKHREEHLEYHRARDRKYREANREKELKRRRRYREANPERMREQARKYSETHREQIRECVRKWAKAHPEQVRAKTVRRMARKARTVCDLSIEEQEEILARRCFFVHLGDCEGPLCIAHDVALSKGGNTTRANVLCLCRRHNSQMRTQGLAEILEQLEMF